VGGHLNYEVPNWTVPNRNTLNWILWSQTKVCIAKSWCVNKREDRARLKVTDTIFCFVTFPVVEFLKKHDRSEAGLVSIFRLRSI